MAKAPELFAPTNLMGGNAAPIDDLFAQPKTATPQSGGFSASSNYASQVVTRATRPHTPTKTELKAQAEADRQAQVNQVRSQIVAMQQSPEWLNASLDRKQELYEKWRTQKWTPMINAIQDTDLQEQLSVLPGEILNADISNLKKSISDSSRISDVWQGVKATTLQTGQGLGDILPAVVDQGRIDNLRNMLAMDGQPLVLGGVPQLKSDGSPVIQQFTPEQRAEVEAQIKELEGSRNTQLKEAVATEKEIQDIRNRQSIGQIDRDRELQEDIANRGGFVGTLANAVANPSNALQLAAEQLPNAAVAIGATAIGRTAGAQLASSVLSGQDAMSSAFQQVQQLSPEQLNSLPLYQELVNGGMEPERARDELALRAGMDALGLGATVGVLTGGLGAEAGLGRSISSIIAREAGPEAAQTYARTVARQLPTLGRELAVEGVEEGSTQLAANVAQNRQTGTNTDIMQGVGEAAAQGIIAAGPLSATTVAQETIRANRNPTITDTGGDTGVSGAEPAPANPVTPPATGGIDSETTIEVPDAQAAAQQTAPAESNTVDNNAATQALASLRAVFDDINSRDGTAFEATEANAFIDELLTAEDNGAPTSIIENALNSITRAIPPGLGYSSIADGYRQRRAARGEASTDEMASAIVTNEVATNGEAEPVAGAADAGAATVDNIDSAMATPAAASEAAPTAVPEAPVTTGGETEVAGDGGASSDSTATNGGNTGTDETVGAIDRAITADNGSDNPVVSAAGETVSAGERDVEGTAGQRPADGGSTASTPASTQGSDAGVGDVQVGDTVTYQGGYKGAKAMTGTVLDVGSDGTFTLSVRGQNRTSSYGNLPVTGIRENASAVERTAPATSPAVVGGPEIGSTIPFRVSSMGGITVTGQVTQVNADGTFNTTELANIPISDIVPTDAQGQTATQAEMSREDNADSLARLEEAVAANLIPAAQARRLVSSATRRATQANDRTLAGDIIDEYLDSLSRGEIETRPADDTNITPEGRHMISLRSSAMSALASNDTAVLNNVGALVRALEANDMVAADAAASALQAQGVSRMEPLYTAAPAPRNDAQEQLGVQAAPDAADAVVSQAMAETITPSGYNVQKLTQKADALSESDSDHAFTGALISQALEDGDVAKADELAQYLYESGLKQFKPPQNSQGRAARTIEDVFLNELEPAERLALQREYAEMRDTLPPEADTFQAFRDTAVQDQMLMDSGEAPNSDIMMRISKFGRAIIQKLARGLAMVLAAITISNMVPINDAVAATGQGYVQNVQQVQGLSQGASTVSAWVQASKDNNGRPYIIADKEAGEIHIIDGNGKVLATAPALYGSKIGDGMSLGETPAGIFTVHNEVAPSSYGGDLQQFATAPNGDVYAIHRVLTNNRQGRPERLASPSAADNRISLGCINIPADVYNKFMPKNFNGKLYVMPDQRSLGDVFKGIDEIRAKQNLTEGQQQPQDFTSPTATEYQSSTSALAPADFSETGRNVLDTAAAVTEAAQDGDLSTAQAFTAAQSNDAADGDMVFAAALPFLAFGRNQRRAQKGKKGQSPSGIIPPNTPPRSVSDQDYHSVEAVIGKQQTTTSNQPAHAHSWISDATTKLAQKLSDSQYAFIDWMGSTGLVPRDGEFDAHPAIYALKSQNNRMRQRNEQFNDRYMMPVFNHVVAVAQRLGRNPDMVGMEMGSWQTFRHVPEANRALRQNLVDDLNNIMLTGTQEDIIRAQERIQAFDAVQAGTRPIADLKKLGVGGLAGGMTDAQARAGIQIVESRGYRPEELLEYRSRIRSVVDSMVQERLNSGTLLQEEVDQWNAHGFQEYVPLYVNHEREDAANDVYLGTSNFNPAGDYTRHGSVTRASHSMITVQQMLYRTAAGIESKQFKDELHKMYVQSKPAGLGRVNLADQRMRRGGEFFNQELYDKRGFLHLVRSVDQNGEPVITRYKYYFEDDAIAQGIFDNHAEPDWKVTKLMGAMTAGFGKLLTKYNPLFPVKTWWRDAGERRRTLAARKITDSQGNVIPLRRLYTGMMASLYNPVHVFNLGAYLFTGARENSPTVRAFRELQQLGGVSTYQHALSKSVTDMRTTLKGMSGLRKHARSLDRFFTHWNEAWSAAPAVAGYMSLRNMDVPADQAAFRTLDVMNASNKGEWHGTLSTFYPFIAPTFEGGRNFLRSMKTRRGQAIFAANVVTSIALYSMLWSLASSMAGDDDDRGNLLDNMTMDDLSMNIPLIINKDDIIKIPVAFGMSRASWMIGAGLHRMMRGVDTPGKVAGATSLAVLRELQPIELETQVMTDNFIAGLVLSAAPSVLSPMLEVAMNTNHFGGMIHSTAAREGFASDSARSTTPQVWTDIAKTLRESTGGVVDMYPENIRHLSQAWLVGPLRGLGTALERGSLYTTGGNLTARQEIGPVWDAVGVAQFWDNGSRGVSRTYYKYQDKADDILRKYGQLRTAAGTKPGDAATAAYRRVIVAGGSPEEALLVRYAIEADKARERSNKDMKAKVKQMKAADLNLEILAPQYEAHAGRQERDMRKFIRQARGLE